MATQDNTIAGSGYGNVYIDSLIWGDGWTGSPITYSFRSGIDYKTGYGYFAGASWSSAETNAVASILNSYSAVCNVTFSRSADNSTSANLGFWSVSSYVTGGHQGEFETPNNTHPQLSGYFNYSDPGYWYLQPGGQGYEVFVHEIGHALGLAHPHDGGVEYDKTIFPGATEYTTGVNGLNQRIWTVMSYNPGWAALPRTNNGYGDASTPMAFDIAALQALYGANTSYHTGDDSYVLPTSDTGWSCIWDARGADTINGASTTGGCTIYLVAAPLTGAAAGGFVSYTQGIVGGFTIANNVVIENAIGGYGDDFIYGNSSNNLLQGGAGNDTLVGGGGNDTIICGEGIGDVCTYYFSRANYTITYSSGVYTVIEQSGADGTDTITGVEYFQFSDQSGIASSFIDTTPPTIAISSNKSTLKAGETATITFTLSETSTNFTVDDVAATGGGLSNFTGSGTAYTATFTPTVNSTANGVVSVASNTFTDATGNSNADGADTNNTLTMGVDTLLPTIAISSNKSTLKAGETATITFILSEAAADYVSSGLTVSGGTLSTLSGSGTSYTATFTPTVNSTASGVVSVGNGAFTDAAGNSNADGADANNTLTIGVDTVAPTVSTFSPADATTGVAIGSNIVVTFSEAIQFGTGNIEIHSGSATGTLLASYVAGSSSNLTISGSTLTINPTSDLAYSTQYFVTFASGAIKDSAGNSYAGITTYDFTTSAAPPNHLPTGTVTITGTKAQGQTLTASNTLADADGLGTLSYQWKANNVDIGGATSSTYRLTQSEVGKAIKVTASYTDNLGTAESATSVNTSSIANAQFAPTGGVTISGTAAQNQTLTANTSLLTDADGLGTLSYVWKMSGKAISGATASTYALTQAHVGKAITVVVSYKDGDNKAETVTSAATSSVVNVNDAPTVAISISTKTAIEGKTFSLTIPTNTFVDLDKDTLTYTAKLNGTLLTNSDWLTLASGKLTATKVPYTAADTANTVTVIANDGHGGTVFTSFALNVTNTSTINGTAANDAIVAGNGNDIISGLAGNDSISGGSGNDTLNGGVGNDTLTGGDGTDYFVLNAALSTTTNRDTITDFTSGDHIQLENAVFKKLLVAGALNTANFVSGVAVDANDYILYNSSTGVLSYDADGNGAGAAVQIALIGTSTHAALTYADFVVI